MPSRCEVQLIGASNQAHLKKVATRIDPWSASIPHMEDGEPRDNAPDDGQVGHRRRGRRFDAPQRHCHGHLAAVARQPCKGTDMAQPSLGLQDLGSRSCAMACREHPIQGIQITASKVFMYSWPDLAWQWPLGRREVANACAASTYLRQGCRH